MARPVFSSTKCAKCGKDTLIRPDKLPFCLECEDKMCEEFAEKIRPDIGKKGKVILRSDAVD